ncbi:MAG: RuBisCO large subunit C-terminal-like domain-containing protein [Paracoccaceae bacterium]
MFMCGGGILAHPEEPEASVASLREAYDTLRDGDTLEDGARTRPNLAAALRFFGGR